MHKDDVDDDANDEEHDDDVDDDGVVVVNGWSGWCGLKIGFWANRESLSLQLLRCIDNEDNVSI